MPEQNMKRVQKQNMKQVQQNMKLSRTKYEMSSRTNIK